MKLVLLANDGAPIETWDEIQNARLDTRLGAAMLIEEITQAIAEPRELRPGRASQPAGARHAGDLAGYLREREGDDTLEV